jgi:hypothetical protein
VDKNRELSTASPEAVDGLWITLVAVAYQALQNPSPRGVGRRTLSPVYTGYVVARGLLGTEVPSRSKRGVCTRLFLFEFACRNADELKR